MGLLMTVRGDSGEVLGFNGRRLSGIKTVSMGAALVMSVTLNVLLAHKVRSLDNTQSAKLADLVVQVGTTVPPVTAKRLDGGSEQISYEGTAQPTVLYVFTPTCVWCARNLNNLKTLLANDSGQYRFIALSLSDEGVPQYVEKNGLKIPVYSVISPETAKTYKLGSTPQTIVISPRGRVLQDWVGAYVGSQKSQVEAFFHTTLPGLLAVPEPSSATSPGK